MHRTFDHTMRFAYGINATQRNDSRPAVEYWRDRNGEVDFVFEVEVHPVPVRLAYQSRDQEESLAAVQESRQIYETPLGFLITGDTVRGGQPIEEVDDGIIRLPYWLHLLLC